MVVEVSVDAVRSIELVREPSGCEAGGAAPGGGGGALTELSVPDDTPVERGMTPVTVNASDVYDGPVGAGSGSASRVAKLS